LIRFWAEKIVNGKALIALCSCSTYKINNAVSGSFSQQNDQLIIGFGIMHWERYNRSLCATIITPARHLQNQLKNNPPSVNQL
jgi:hypothetical protein